MCLISRCKHKYIIVEEYKLYETPDSRIPYSIRALMKCEKCGKYKIKKFI